MTPGETNDKKATTGLAPGETNDKKGHHRAQPATTGLVPVEPTFNQSNMHTSSNNPAPLPTHTHFVGIGGVGMSGIATILLDCGHAVSGSDEVRTDTLDRLESRGATIAIGHRPENVPQNTRLLVHSSAVPESNPERQEATRRGIRQIRRGEFLAEIARNFDSVIAVAGSHGKTTTTAMIAHILRHAGLAPGFLVGGDVPGWTQPAAGGAGRILVTEVDESDASQSAMHASIAVVTNIEDDHCWSVGGIDALEQCFAKFAHQAGTVLAWNQDGTRRVLQKHPGIRFFDENDIPDPLALPVPGLHNRMNATLAIAAAERLGVAQKTARDALATFQGVKRRFTTHYRAPDTRTALIEDYAHHPTELRMTLATLRETFPDHQLSVIFQPHRFERVKRYAAEFAGLLSSADHVVVYRPFSAWVGDGDIVDPRIIAQAVANVPCTYWDDDIDKLAQQLCELRKSDDRPRVFVVIGAGDVAKLVDPLRNGLVDLDMKKLRARLEHRFSNLPLSDHRPWRQLTTLGIGAAQPLVASPAGETELVELLRFANSANIPVLALGNGSNLVGSDRPDVLLAVRLDAPHFTRIQINHESVSVGAGATLGQLVRTLIDADRIAPELTALGWIPGTVGGALRMNAGADGVEIGHCVTRLHGVRRDGERWEADGDTIAWSYRHTDIPEDVLITCATLVVDPKNANLAKSAFADLGDRRRERQPQAPSAGSVFKNAGDAPAGKLIESSLMAGDDGTGENHCKPSLHGDKPHGGGNEDAPPPSFSPPPGLSRWGERSSTPGSNNDSTPPSPALQISGKHANFIVRTGDTASERDMERLMVHILRRVYSRTGIRLRPEVIFVNSLTRTTVESAVAPRTIAVLLGGPSKEREISLKSGQAVAAALRDAGHTVHEVDVTHAALPDLPPNTDLVVPMLHGTFGEDGTVQRLLEERRVPYVGSGPEASRLMMDKQAAKTLLASHGIAVPRATIIDSPDAPPPDDASFPLIVKPNSQGSSVGLTKLENANLADWRRALAAAFAVDERVLVEQFVAGIEITVGVLHGRALPVIEIVPPPGHLFDFDAKYVYSHGTTRYLCPPETVADPVQRTAQDLAVRAAELFDARHLVRIDFIVDAATNTPVFIEANSIPGFTATSLLPKAAARTGLAFVELCASFLVDKKSRWDIPKNR